MQEVGELYHLDRTSVSRRLYRARKRLQSYARDRARLRREVMGEEVDPEQLLRDLACFDKAPRQRQVLTRFLEGQANFEIAADLHLQPSHVSRTRKRGAAKLEVLGDDADELRRRVRWGDRALLGSWKIERYGPNHPGQSIAKYDTTNPRAGGDEEGTA